MVQKNFSHHHKTHSKRIKNYGRGSKGRLQNVAKIRRAHELFQDRFNISTMRLQSLCCKLAHFVRRIANFWSGDYDILRSIHNWLVCGRIFNIIRPTFGKFELPWQRCRNTFCSGQWTFQPSTVNLLLNFGLRQNYRPRGGVLYLNSMEVIQDS
jgi:hypothetical protein